MNKGEYKMKIITATAVALSLTIGNALADVKIKGSDYYEGKTVTIYVGAGASGGTGMYGQLVKNWIGKFIPGNPDIKVKHVSGGGGVRVGKQAVAGVIDSTEGLSIIMFPGSISLAGSAIPTEKSINYKPTDFPVVGSLLNEASVMAVDKNLGINNIKDLMGKPTVWASFGKTSSATVLPKMVAEFFDNIEVKIVRGYKGSGNAIKAIASGEVNALAVSMSTFSKKAKVVPQGLSYIAAVGDKSSIPVGVPDILDIVKPKYKKYFQFYADTSPLGRSFYVHKSTPAEYQKILTESFDRMLVDKDFLAFAKSKKLAVNPVSAKLSNQKLKDIENIDPDVQKYLRDLMWK
jgi:tripartite-type tricarboxylate transporter receptor subunit TctC|tara:strand:+ start:2068 stop:3111 length:1044 start_codon:yes stop_codon:yes gene_type:complete